MPTVESKVWVFGDYKQAEARVVAWRGPVPKMKEFFSSEVDVHTEVARLIAKVVQEHKLNMPGTLFKKKPWQLLSKEDKDERQIGKTTAHAGNYGIGKNTLSHYLKGIPPKYAEIILAVYHSIFPEVKRGYQKWIDDCLHKNSTVVTPFGRPKVFYDIPSEERSKKAYAYYGQSTVGDLLTKLIVRLCEHFEELSQTAPDVVLDPGKIRRSGFDVRLNIHDAVGISVPNDPISIDHVVRVVEKESAIPMEICGDTLVIPMDIKVGPSWGEAKDYQV
jgi:DNA polymerase I-like protein with 3'-5' exonuclease and polymerase domains